MICSNCADEFDEDVPVFLSDEEILEDQDEEAPPVATQLCESCFGAMQAHLEFTTGSTR